MGAAAPRAGLRGGLRSTRERALPSWGRLRALAARQVAEVVHARPAQGRSVGRAEEALRLVLALLLCMRTTRLTLLLGLVGARDFPVQLLGVVIDLSRDVRGIQWWLGRRLAIDRLRLCLSHIQHLLDVATDDIKC